MGRTILLLITVALVAYYVYTPLPGDIEEPWKLILEITTGNVFRNLTATGKKLAEEKEQGWRVRVVQYCQVKLFTGINFREGRTE
ncbi:hypothetical protein ACRRTK_010428 [Alexandromys fortis]